VRIHEWHLDAVSIPYFRPMRWEGSEERAANLLLLRLITDSGGIGFAEATVKVTWSGTTIDLARQALSEIFIPRLAGVDFTDAAAFERALAIPGNELLKGLLDNARWQLIAQAAGKPLWQCWGGSSQVPVSWIVGRQAPLVMAREAESCVDRFGFGTLKVKCGQGLSVDKEAVACIRAAVGPVTRLFVDCNGVYDIGEARTLMRELLPLGVTVFEDPCRFEPDAQFREFQSNSEQTVLIEAPCVSLRDARSFIANGARSLSVKPARYGSSEALRIVREANEAGCSVHVGWFGESDAGALASLQVAASISSTNALAAESGFCLAFQDSILSERISIKDGIATLPDRPTLSELVDWAKVEALRVV
jgi:L-alanine-DL-glutamate epimerase-like enolase superfamily enzyme